MKHNLNNIPIDELLAAVLVRIKELFEKGNWLISAAFALYKAMCPVLCIDGIPWRISNGGRVELMALRRRTGPFPDKLVLIGGTVARGESLQDALQRHFKDDFGVEIEMEEDPFCMSQYHSDKPDDRWLQDPGKDHVVSPVYLVQIQDETPKQSVQGDSVEWFSREAMPPDEEFGYATERLYHKAFHLFNAR